MKNIVTICLAVSTFTVAQDTTVSVNQEPQLPGWGLYVGGAFSSAASVEDLTDGHTYESRFVAPNIGISKGLFLGGIPLIVGAGYHPRGFTHEFSSNVDGSKQEADFQFDMVDFWATIPYPIGDRVILQGGFLAGTCIGASVSGVDGAEDPDAEGELDFGLLLGGGVAITEQIGANIGYYVGLAEFDEMAKFSGIVFNVGYYF